ncbi:MAG: single-stranded DNA-binding protein [Terriglobales bacterium]
MSRTEWHRVIAWGKRGDFAKNVAKGSHVHVEGELRWRLYTGKDNVLRRICEVHLGSIRKLDRKLDRADRSAQAASTLEQSADAPAGVPF